MKGVAMRAYTPRARSRILATIAVLPCLAIAVSAAAQGGKTELGSSLGVTVISSGGQSNTHFGVPAGVGPLSIFSPVFYATCFTNGAVFIEPQFGVSVFSGGGGSTGSIVTLVGQVGVLTHAGQSSSPYLAVSGAFQRVGGGSSSTMGVGLGGELGYRSAIRSNLALRVNVRGRRWFSDFADTNEFGFGLGLGAVL
jgi:hypothetical protein